MKKKLAVYPGTFDPITFGHVDVIERAMRLFDELVVVVAQNTRKETLFSASERVKFIQQIYRKAKNIRVIRHSGLVVDLTEKIGASAIIRGLRAVSDFEYELQLALTNRTLNSRVETVFLMPDAKFIYLNSSVVKEVARFGGELSHFVPPVVEKALQKRFRSK